MPARLVLLGHPVAHSLSPLIQDAALRAAGLPLSYTTWDVPPGELAAALRDLTAEQGAGNITTPHKQSALGLCSRLSPTAQRVGAVNTFWVEEGRLVGDNTDVGGFERAVVRLRGSVPAHAVIAVLGAGGAASAVLAAIADWPDCRARVFNRTAAHADSLVARFRGVAVATPTAAAALADATLVVNTTTVGLVGDEFPIDVSLLPREADVMDLVYRPDETAWTRVARARGHRSCDGLPMLIEQGALAFERWFGFAPDRNAMWAAVENKGDRPHRDAGTH